MIQVLADKVAILHNGSLLAEGAVSYLKKKFDAGFHLIAKHKHNLIYNQTVLSSSNSLETSISNEHVNEESVYKQLINHVKSFVPNAKYLIEDDADDMEDGYANPFNDVKDESLLSRFHLPYVSENLDEEEDHLHNIQRLLASLDKDGGEMFNIDSYILDCTSLEQIFMSLLHVSRFSKYKWRIFE